MRQASDALWNFIPLANDLLPLSWSNREIPERTRTVSFLISTQPGVQWTQWKGRQNACEL